MGGTGGETVRQTGELGGLHVQLSTWWHVKGQSKKLDTG